MKFEIWQGVDGQWYWHLKARNHAVVLQGEGHPTKGKAERAVKRLKGYAITGKLQAAPVVES